MNIHNPFHLQARNIFKKIYQGEKINIEASRKTLEEQLALYLDHLSSHLNKNISQTDMENILSIIERNNQVAEILKSPEYLKISQKMRENLSGVALGLVFCIDGRIPAIFLGGRFASHWEIPAAELAIAKRKSDNVTIPTSSELCESLRLIVNRNKELLEIVFAHTSLLDPSHGCGAMAAKRAAANLDSKLSNEDANLKIINEVTIPSITNLYNEFRLQTGSDPLKIVGISALYDTDTFGIVLNYDKRESGRALFTTDITNKYKEQLDDYYVKKNIVFGSFSERFSSLKFLPTFHQKVLMVTQDILENNPFQNLIDELNKYLNENFGDLTKNQQKALKSYLVRTIAMQYLTGSSALSKKTIHHAFANHEEKYMAVSTRGTTIGKFDPQDQGFSSTPSDPISAVSTIKTKLSIMEKTGHNKKEAYLLFICNPVSKKDLKENSIQLHKIMDANAELWRTITNDKELWEMIKEEELIPVSVLIEQDTREVLKIVDHSAYI